MRFKKSRITCIPRRTAMRIRVSILFALLAVAYALPSPEGALLTKEQLENKAREVEAFVTQLYQIKKIALAPSNDVDWEQPDSDFHDIEAFLAIIDLLKNVAFTTEGFWQLDNQERNVEEVIDILDHLKSWVLATGAEMEQLDSQGYNKKAFLTILYLIKDIEGYVVNESHNREAFLAVLDGLSRMMLTTGGDWEQLDVKQFDKEAFQAVFNVLRTIEKFKDTKQNVF